MMHWPAIVIIAGLFWLGRVEFERRAREAAIVGNVSWIASLRRWKSVGSLGFWLLIGVWLYIRPPKAPWICWGSWIILIALLIEAGWELRQSFSTESNKRFAAEKLRKS